MSNKVKKAKKSSIVSGWEVLASVMEYVLAATMIAMCVAVSFYAKEGYNQIGNAKFAAYRAVMVIGFSIFLMMGAAYLVYFLRQKKERNLSITDGFVLAYLLFSTISVVSGGFYKDALWGYFGWNMGWMSQLSFVLIYLALSRFGKYYHVILTAFGVSSGIVFLIAVLHRMLIDPIGFYEGLEGYQMAQFLSTMGQATWYASYLVVALPVGLAVFLFSEKKWQSILGGIYTAVGFASLVTQNSDSAYFALAGFMLIFFLFCIEKRETLNRFAEACTVFFAAGKVMYYLMQIHPNPDLEYDFITEIMLNGKITWVLLGLCLLLDLFLYVRRNRPYSAVRMLWVRRVVLARCCVWLLWRGLSCYRPKAFSPADWGRCWERCPILTGTMTGATAEEGSGALPSKCLVRRVCLISYSVWDRIVLPVIWRRISARKCLFSGETRCSPMRITSG